MNKLTFFTSCSALCVIMACAIPSYADRKKNVLDIKESITDNNIVFPEANYEAESRKMLEGWYMQNYMATDDRYKSKDDVATSDDTYRRRLSELPTLIEMPFNQVVKSHIERYTKKGRPMVASLLGLSNYYMPIFEQALEEKGLPLELKYLPVIESALEPNAVSRAGATGLWQFMLVAAKGLNMEVNSLVDERRDPYVSSQRAAKFLQDLYNTYGDWSLAIAAYNCGPGNVNKALRRAQNDGTDPSKLDFWAIYNYLPSETRGYVPAFIAANYVMNYYDKHNISPVIPKRPLVTDTVHINKRVHLNQISKVLNIPLEELRMLNPQFRADVIPGTSSKSYNLILPSQQVHAYIMSEEDILNYESEKYARRVNAEPGKVTEESDVTDTFVATAEPEEDVYREMAEAPVRKKAEPAPAPAKTTPQRTVVEETPTLGPSASDGKTHKVEPGESIASIAAKYGVSPEQLKSWNNLKRNSVRTGQVLKVAGANTVAKTSTPAQEAPRKSANATRKAEEPAKKAEPVTKKTEVAKKTETTKKTEVAKKTETTKKAEATKKTETASTSKKNKANTPQAQTTAKKGGKAAQETTVEPKRKGKKGAAQETAATTKGKGKKAEAAQPVEHTVQKGESYDKIAKKHGVTVEELKKANNAKSDLIQPDQKLKIPKKTAAKDTKDSKASSKKETTSKKESAKKETSSKKSSKKK